MGSTANKKALDNWDDFDIRVYTKSKHEAESYYEILVSGNEHFLLSAYFYQLDLKLNPDLTVLEQKDVEVLYGRRENLSHIYVWRPRHVEPLAHDLPKFDIYYERFFEILVDILFILRRYESRGRPNSTKACVARDGLRTICEHFYRFYGVHTTIPKGTRWRTMMNDLGSLLVERNLDDICQNKGFVRAGIELLSAA